MKLGVIFTLLFCISTNLYAQSPEIKKIFFGLPLDSSRNVVCKTIRGNSMFTEIFMKEIVSDSILYIGQILDTNQHTSKSDSATIFVEGYPEYEKKYRKNKKDTLDKNRFTIGYDYSSREAMLLEYENYLNKIRPLAKDSMDVEDEGEYIITGKCYFLKKRKNLPQIQIAWQEGWKGRYLLSVTYIRE